MKKERDEKKEREARLLKRQQLKILSQSLVARRNLGEYMGKRSVAVLLCLQGVHQPKDFQGVERGGLHRSQRRKSPAYMGNAHHIESGKAAH